MQIDINYDNGLSDIANNIENNFADIIGQDYQAKVATQLLIFETDNITYTVQLFQAGR